MIVTTGIAVAALLTGCVPTAPQPFPETAPGLTGLWEESPYDPARPSVEWADPAAGAFRLTFMGAAYCDERLEGVDLGVSGANVRTDALIPGYGCPDVGEMKTFLTALPAGFDPAVPVLVSINGRVVGRLAPAVDASDPPSWPWTATPTVLPVGPPVWADPATRTVRWTTGGGCGIAPDRIRFVDSTTVDIQIQTPRLTRLCEYVLPVRSYITVLPAGVSTSGAIDVLLDGVPFGTLPRMAG